MRMPDEGTRTLAGNSDIFRETEARLRDARLKRITEDSEHGAKSSLDGRAWARR
jgi:hypothetical protein